MYKRNLAVALIALFSTSIAHAGVLIGHPRLTIPLPQGTTVVTGLLVAPQVVLQRCDGQPPATLSNVTLDAIQHNALVLPLGTWCGMTFPAGAELSADLDVEDGTLWLEADLPAFSVALPDALIVSPQHAASTLELGTGAWINLLPPEVAEGADLALQPSSSLAQQIAAQIAAHVTLVP